MRKNTILVTGGCGYIGSHTLVEIIEQTGYEVISIDNHISSSPDALAGIGKITGKTPQNYAVDLCDYQASKKVFEAHPNLVGVIHFAALKSVPDSVAEPLVYYHNNLESLINILRLCEEFEVKNFIFSSSCSVYGNVKTLPVTENTPFPKAESPYAYTKQIGEQFIQDFVKKKNNSVRCIALRYFNPVGAHISGLIGENPINPPTSLVPIITQTAAGLREKMFVWGNDYDTRDGSCIRDYIHVSDIAAAHLVALNYLIREHKQFFEVFNLGTGEGVSVLEAIQAFETSTNIKLNYQIAERREGDVEAVYSDTEKTSKILQWKPQYGIKEMMQSAWKWQQMINLHTKK